MDVARTKLRERNKRCVDCEGQLHGQLRRNDAGDDEDTVKQKLPFLHLSFDTCHTWLSDSKYNQKKILTFDPDIPARSDSEDQEEPNEQERLQIVRRNALSRENHCSDKLTLRGSESSTKDNAETTTIRSISCSPVFGQLRKRSKDEVWRNLPPLRA